MGGSGSGRHYLQTKDKVATGILSMQTSLPDGNTLRNEYFGPQYAHAHARHGVRYE